MSGFRPWLPALLSVVPLLPAAGADQAGSDGEAGQFEQRIARLVAVDPLQPATIRERIAYARLLHESAADSQCLARLDEAGRQLEPILSAPADQLLASPDAVPDALALLQTVQLSRAECLDGEAAAASLRESISTGDRAIGLLEANWDYGQMAIARFNVAVARRRLGDAAGAVRDLEQVVAWDREFGQLADALADYETLLAWRAREGEGPDAAALEAFSAGLVQRRVTPAFRLWPQKYRWDAANERLESKDGKPSGLKWTISGTSTVTRDREDWLITTTPDEPARAESTPPSPGPDVRREVLDEMLTAVLSSNVPQAVIAPDGGFKEVRNLEGMRASMVGVLNRVVEELPVEERERVRPVLQKAIETVLSAERLTASMANEWGLSVASWVGTEMDHGDWYEVQTKGPLPGLSDRLVTSVFRFRLARWLPCAGPGSGECIEIQMRNTPDPAELSAAVGDMMRRLVPDDAAKLEAAMAGAAFDTETRYRLVAEPATLRAWSFETRKYLYVATLEGGRRTASARREPQVQRARYEGN